MMTALIVQKKNHVQGFFKHVNDQHESIAFTVEDSEGNVLDVMWRRAGETISTDVYRKTIHTDRCLQWDSHYPVAHKCSVVGKDTLPPSGDWHRRRGQKKNGKGEDKKTDLRWCLYPSWALQEGQKKDKKTKTSAQREQKLRSETHVVIQYVPGMTEQLQWVYKKHNIVLHSKLGYTLRQALVAPKDKLSSDEKQGVIYSMRCEGCDGEYVGKTERSLDTGMKEHRTSVIKANEKSALSTNNLKTSHTFDWNHNGVVGT